MFRLRLLFGIPDSGTDPEMRDSPVRAGGRGAHAQHAGTKALTARLLRQRPLRCDDNGEPDYTQLQAHSSIATARRTLNVQAGAELPGRRPAVFVQKC